MQSDLKSCRQRQQMRTAGLRPGDAARRSPILALAVLAISGVTACDRTASQTGAAAGYARRATVAIVPPAEAPLTAVIQGGALRYARDVPSVHVEVVAPKGAGLDARFEGLVEALSRPLDAVCFYLSVADVRQDGPRLREQLANLSNRGTPIITIGAELDAERVTGHVGAHLPDAAMLAGRELKSLVAPQRTFVLIHNDGRGDVERDAAQRLRSEAAKHPDLVLLREAEGDMAAATPRDVIADLVTLFPAVGLVVTLDPTPWLDSPLEWERALRERARSVRFVTLATDPRLWRRLGTPEEPGLAAGLVGPLDGDLAYEAVRMAVELVSGERRGSPTRRVAVELVTPSNLPEFARRYAAAANGVDLSSYLPRPAATQPGTQP